MGFGSNPVKGEEETLSKVSLTRSSIEPRARLFVLYRLCTSTLPITVNGKNELDSAVIFELLSEQ